MKRHRVCEVCGKNFDRYPSSASPGRGRFCSVDCRLTVARKPLEVRFWSKVNRSGPTPAHVPNIGQCWVWLAGKNAMGYGRIRPGGKATPQEPAHRMSWKLAFGPIPDGLFVCHRCDNPPCIRPDHLFLGTAADNSRDKHSKGREAKGMTNGAYTCPDRRPRGEASGRAKLSLAEVTEIRQSYRPVLGELTRLGKKFNVTRTTIANIINGTNWQ